jgi:N-acetylmuramoyl-L-alanine amidase
MQRKLLIVLTALFVIAFSLPHQASAAPAPQDGVPHAQLGVRATIKIATLNVRRAPRASATIIGTLKLNQVVPATGRDRLGSWVEVQSPFGKGWINSRYILLTEDLLSLPITYVRPFVIVIANPFAHVRSGPFTSYPIISRVPYNADLDIVGLHSKGTMVQVQLPTGKVGWISTDIVKIGGDLTDIPFTDRTVLPLGQITSYRVRVRAAPRPTGAVITTVRLGQQYTILGVSSNGLYYLISGTFGTGWVFADYVRVLGYSSIIPVVG